MERLLHFRSFVDEITSDNSRNYKISVIEKYKDDETIKYFLNFLFNPYITTGISDKKLNRQVEISLWDSIENIATTNDLLEYIKKNNTGRDEVLKTIKLFKQNILSQYDTDINLHLEDLLDKIITKNLILGIDVLTINKVIPNLIPTFNVQLANKYFDKPEYVEGKWFALTTKIDGGRIIALKQNGIVEFYTRAGQKYEGLVDLEKELSDLPIDNICFDGEITLLNPYEVEYDDKGRPSIGRKLTSKEQYKQTMMITRKDGEKHGIKMLVFDCMLASEFKSQKCDSKYLDRRAYLNKIFEENKLTYFNNLEMLYEGEDTSEITKWLKYNVEHGEEGVMINIVTAPYEFKRTNNLLKVKLMKDVDLKVIGFEEGTNRFVGSLGALIVDYKGNELKVGSGFTDELRSEIWSNQDKWLGRTVVIQYFEETTNQNGGTSLRFPIYLDWRDDK